MTRRSQQITCSAAFSHRNEEMLSVKCAENENSDAMTGKRRNQRLHNPGGLKIERPDGAQAYPIPLGLHLHWNALLIAYDRKFIIRPDYG
jgi:hypothetical protein